MTSDSNENIENAAASSRMVRKRSSFKRLFAIRESKYDSIALFYSSLKADLVLIEASNDVGASEPIISTIRATLGEIDDNISNLENWNKAYFVERLIASLFSPERTWIELQKVCSECTIESAPFAGFYERQIALLEPLALKEKLGNGKQKKIKAEATYMSPEILLQRLLSDTQRFHSQDYVKRSYAREAIIRVSWAFFASFVLFALVLVFVR